LAHANSGSNINSNNNNNNGSDDDEIQASLKRLSNVQATYNKSNEDDENKYIDKIKVSGEKKSGKLTPGQL